MPIVDQQGQTQVAHVARVRLIQAIRVRLHAMSKPAREHDIAISNRTNGFAELRFLGNLRASVRTRHLAEDDRGAGGKGIQIQDAGVKRGQVLSGRNLERFVSVEVETQLLPVAESAEPPFRSDTLTRRIDEPEQFRDRFFGEVCGRAIPRNPKRRVVAELEAFIADVADGAEEPFEELSGQRFLEQANVADLASGSVGQWGDLFRSWQTHVRFAPVHRMNSRA